ncbi:hypothetical protein BHE74_00011764 [Ensete ventricosum]|nr:hypothetical protein GW17_00024548 [Ensete ventricosum]RWW79918.1 hypothetical protein BHE74_00011764 [Ensete ventricosum]
MRAPLSFQGFRARKPRETRRRRGKKKKKQLVALALSLLYQFVLLPLRSTRTYVRTYTAGLTASLRVDKRHEVVLIVSGTLQLEGGSGHDRDPVLLSVSAM